MTENILTKKNFVNLLLWGDISSFKSLQVLEKGYKRLTPDQPVGLRHSGYVISVTEIIRGRCGDVMELRATCAPASANNKPKAFIHWVCDPINIEVRLYERL